MIRLHYHLLQMLMILQKGQKMNGFAPVVEGPQKDTTAFVAVNLMKNQKKVDLCERWIA